MNIAMWFLVATILLVVIGGLILFFLPGFIVSFTQKIGANSAGLKKKTVLVDGYLTHYYEGGSGETVVLLHGMADDKNSFVKVASELTQNHHVILPELQGHGENEMEASRDYSIHGQVEFLDNFFTAINVNSFDLGGNSMGGHVSVAYALAHPNEVKKLILINAPGLKLDDHVVYSGFGNKMQNRDDFYAVMDRVFYKRPSMPGPVVDYMVEETNSKFDFINGLAEAVKTGEDFDLKDRVSAIMIPTLILWGEHDSVVKFNVAEAYQRLIPNSELVIINEAGHSPQLEKASEIGLRIKQFL